MRPPLTARAVHILRHAVLLAIGPAVLITQGAPAELTAPARCGGALDLTAIGVAHAWPDLTFGTVVGVFQVVALCAALWSFAEFADRTTGRLAVALSIAAALGISGLFSRALALPGEAAAFAACAMCALAAQSMVAGRTASAASALAVGAALAFAVSIVPAWAAAAAVCACIIVWRTARRVPRTSRAAAALVIVAVLLALGGLLLRANQSTGFGNLAAWSTCARPSTANLGLLNAALGGVGPVVLALAALGLWRVAAAAGLKHVGLAAALLAVAILPGAGGSWRAGVALAPVLFVVWWLAAVGLVDVTRLMGTGRAALVGTAAAAVVLPLLQWTVARARERDDIIRPLGHQRASAREIRSLINLVPAGSGLVEEDASVDLLLRAAVFGRRSAKQLEVVPRARGAVLSALNAGRSLYAFPLGQRELALRGFELDPVVDPRPAAGPVRGLAAITRSLPCADLGARWVDLRGVGSSGRIAVSAATENAEGPVVVYFGAANAAAPYPDGWPARARRGFDVRIFSRNTAADAARLEAERNETGLLGNPLFAAPFVLKLTLFRTPLSPRALAVVLGAPRAHGVGRLTANYQGALPLTICAAPNVSVSEF